MIVDGEETNVETDVLMGVICWKLQNRSSRYVINLCLGFSFSSYQVL